MENLMTKIISLCKRRGFVYPSSEIYGGFANVYDLGPMGSLLARNIRELWLKEMVFEREDVYLLDGSILMHPKAWEASGHVQAFTDPLVECNSCHKRFRADQLLDWQVIKDNKTGKWKVEKYGSLKCPECEGELSKDVKEFNLLMETSVGTVKDRKSKTYLKGESCQNIFLDYEQVKETMSPSLPFGMAQIGKAFRNEITLGQYLFRLREFEQMDLEYFVADDQALRWYEYWKEKRIGWYQKRVGLAAENLRWRQHSPEERIFYARDAWDIDFAFPMGWKELEGVHDRSDYDLKMASKFSGHDLDYFDSKSGKKFIPNIIECSGGLQRTFLAAIVQGYREEVSKDGVRVVLSIKPSLSPFKVAVFPLLANKPDLVKKARNVYENLKKEFMTAWDDIGNIGKRYRRQDEIGTAWCVTIDFQTLKDDSVTVRDRDSMKQERVKVKELASLFEEKLKE